MKESFGWKNVQLISCDGFKFYFESLFGKLNELFNVQYFYGGENGGYVIVKAQLLFI